MDAGLNMGKWWCPSKGNKRGTPCLLLLDPVIITVPKTLKQWVKHAIPAHWLPLCVFYGLDQLIV